MNGRRTASAGPSSTVPAAAAPARAPDAQDSLGNAAMAEEMRAKTGTTEAQAPDTLAAAEAAHKAQQDLVYGVIDEAARHVNTDDPADPDNLLHNAAEWVKEGEVRLTVLTPTHDKRDQHQVAVFDSTVAWPAKGGTYNAADKTDRTGVALVDKGNEGGLLPGGNDLRLVAPQSKEAVKEVLVHEVQHDADQSWAGQAFEDKPAGWADDATAAWNNYASEFRAFWIGGSLTEAKNTDAANKGREVLWDEAKDEKMRGGRLLGVTPKFRGARQARIFWYLVDNGYAYVRKFAVRNPEFLKKVEALTGPTGGNLVNSVRIQGLSEAIEACKVDDPASAASVQAALTAAGALDDMDRAFLANRSKSAPFWRAAEDSLGADALAALEDAIGTSSP